MIRKAIFVAAAAVLVQSAFAAPMPEPSCFVPGKKFDSRFIGNWEIAQWNVRYSFRAKGKKICMYGRDVAMDEWFDIPEQRWDGKALHVTFIMPSTKWRTKSRLTLIDADSIRDEYTNKNGKHTDTWTRRK